ncbi:MAG: 50S ribosomal protein L25 [Verrucomicrobiota bacterium]
MKSVSLTAYPRTLIKRTGLKKVRGAGRIPAVVYGRHNPPQPLEINLKDIEDLLHRAATENLLVNLNVEGGNNRLALVQEIQHHSLSGKILHVDLHEIVENEKVTVTVPVESAGEAVGVKTGGGVLEHVLFKLKIRCYPKDLPEFLEVDVTHLEVGKSIHIGDIQPPPGVEILGDKKVVVISVAAPITEAQEAAAEAAVTATATMEPEMIKEKKEEEAPPPAEKAAEKKPAEKKK